MLAGHWNIVRRIYRYVHLINIHLPAQRHIYMSLVRLLCKDVPVKRLEIRIVELNETVKNK